MDCVTADKYSSQGCDGGYLHEAFDYIKNNGIQSGSDYPYIGIQGQCCFDKAKSVAQATGFHIDNSGNEENLKNAVATIGPIAAAICANKIQFYAGGIFDAADSEEKLNHAVLVLGYGTENGRDYWLIKNSWGIEWGIKGYLKLARNSNNMCGIGTSQYYPTV